MAAERGFSTAGLVRADLVAQARRAVEEMLSCQSRSPELTFELCQVVYQLHRGFRHLRGVSPEESGFDCMESSFAVRPGIDRAIQLGKILCGHDLGALPSSACRKPGLLRPRE